MSDIIAKYYKLQNGKIGARVVGDEVRTLDDGDEIYVRRADGELEERVISKVLRIGNKGTVALVSLEPMDDLEDLSAYPRTGCRCGSREGLALNSDCRTCRDEN